MASHEMHPVSTKAESGLALVGVSDIEAEVSHLHSVVDLVPGVLPEPFAQNFHQEISAVQANMDAGSGLCVAALVGGTGSGKSQLFNALTGFDFAEVGEIRPTTQEPSACTWSAQSTQILDILGVPESRRIQHDSLLTRDEGMQGLVLLDVPDHDSIDIRHSQFVHDVLPRLDVVIWVLDPQKYADNLIHSAYMSVMQLRSTSMIVVLNQADTIPDGKVDVIVQDIRRLLARDGVDGVPVLSTAALTGVGVDRVADVLRDNVKTARSSLAASKAQLDALGVRIAEALGARPAIMPATEDDEAAVIDQICGQLVEDTGIPSVIQTMYTRAEHRRAAQPTRPVKPSYAQAGAAREQWISFLDTVLPPSWQSTAVGRVIDPDTLARRVDGAVRAVDQPRLRFGLQWLGIAVGAVFCVMGLAVGFGFSLRGRLGSNGWIPFGWLTGWLNGNAGVGVVLALVCIACGVAAVVVFRQLALRRNRRMTTTYHHELLDSIAGVVRDDLVEPSASVREGYQQVYDLLPSASHR